MLNCWAGDAGSRGAICSERPRLKPVRIGVEGSEKGSRSLSRMAMSSFDWRDVVTMCGDGESFGVPPSDKDRVLGAGDRRAGGPRALLSSAMATATSESPSTSDIRDKWSMVASLAVCSAARPEPPHSIDRGAFSVPSDVATQCVNSIRHGAGRRANPFGCSGGVSWRAQVRKSMMCCAVHQSDAKSRCMISGPNLDPGVLHTPLHPTGIAPFLI